MLSFAEAPAAAPPTAGTEVAAPGVPLVTGAADGIATASIEGVSTLTETSTINERSAKLDQLCCKDV